MLLSLLCALLMVSIMVRPIFDTCEFFCLQAEEEATDAAMLLAQAEAALAEIREAEASSANQGDFPLSS